MHRESKKFIQNFWKRCKSRWEDDINTNLTHTRFEVIDWIKLAEDIVQWQFNNVMNIEVSNLLTS
jgi:hypothetical protein